MRTLKLAIALIAVLGWAAAAHAGTVKKVYNVSDMYKASGKTYVYGFPVTFTASVINGSLKAAVYTPASTFTSHASNPPVSAWIHMQKTGMITAMGKTSFAGWTVAGTVKIHVQGSTLCHVAMHVTATTHTSMSRGKAKSDTIIPASCHLVGLWVYTKAHCTGHGVFSGARCKGGFGTPGCWTGATDTHTQKWKAKSVHCGEIKFSHTAMSAHYMKSCAAKLLPTVAHDCGSGSGPHLASSDSGFHVFHIGAKLKSTP